MKKPNDLVLPEAVAEIFVDEILEPSDQVKIFVTSA